MVKLNGVYSPTDSIKGFIPQKDCETCHFDNEGICCLIDGKYCITNSHCFWVVKKE